MICKGHRVTVAIILQYISVSNQHVHIEGTQYGNYISVKKKNRLRWIYFWAQVRRDYETSVRIYHSPSFFKIN